MDVKVKIIQQLEEILSEMGVRDVAVMLEKPGMAEHGDYSSNVALIAAKQLGRNPLQLAEEIVSKLMAESSLELREVQKIEAIKPGFINIFLDQRYLVSQVKSILAGKSRTSSERFTDKKVMLEFTDPNPFKEFHIGHLYTNIIGESLSRLLSAAGAQVKRANYQGDVGLHVAKAVYGMQQKLRAEGLELSEVEKKTLKDRAKFLGESYALGARVYEEDPIGKEAIIALNKQIYAKDPEVWELYHKGRQWSLEYFELIYARLGTKFDYYYFESEVGEFGMQLVKEYLAKGVFVESQGAVIFPGEKYGLHSRVFINSLGLPTYEAKELGLAPLKYQDFAYDQSIIVTANEITEYFKVLLAALQQIRPELAEKTMHLAHGVVRLPEGKMSSRTGNVISGEWLLNEAVTQAEVLVAEKHDAEETLLGKETVELIGKAAVKWALLKSSVGKNIEFSFTESVSFEGNSGPYLQYTYVRTKSVLRKAGEEENDRQSEYFDIDMGLEVEEEQLLRSLAQFPEVVLRAAESFAPHLMTTYLFELAQDYNLFYQKLPILKVPEKKQLRLFLTRATGHVIKQGLALLGIDVPERM